MADEEGTISCTPTHEVYDDVDEEVNDEEIVENLINDAAAAASNDAEEEEEEDTEDAEDSDFTPSDGEDSSCSDGDSTGSSSGSNSAVILATTAAASAPSLGSRCLTLQLVIVLTLAATAVEYATRMPTLPHRVSAALLGLLAADGVPLTVNAEHMLPRRFGIGPAVWLAAAVACLYTLADEPFADKADVARRLLLLAQAVCNGVVFVMALATCYYKQQLLPVRY